MAASSQTLEEKFEEMLRIHAEKGAQIDYLRKQLDQSMRNNRREIQSSCSFSGSEAIRDGAEGGEPSDSSFEERRPSRSRWPTQHHMDFKVEILEFEA